MYKHITHSIATILLLVSIGAGCIPTENTNIPQDNPSATEPANGDTADVGQDTTTDISFVPTIEVQNQSVRSDGTILVDRVNTQDGGWLVLYTSDNGTIRKFLGNMDIAPGEQRDIPIVISMRNISQTELNQATELTVVLYNDNGQEGLFEYGSTDTPFLLSSGQTVQSSFNI